MRTSLIEPEGGAGQPQTWQRWQRDVIGGQSPAEPAPPAEINLFSEAHRDKLATMLRWAADGKHYDEVREQTEELFAEFRRNRPDQSRDHASRESER